MTVLMRGHALRGVLFDKDGTLIDFQRTWGPINRRAAMLAAEGDPALADRLMRIGGMDPDTSTTAGDSLLASSSTCEIASAWAAGGSPLDGDTLARALDALFVASAHEAIPVTDLAALFDALGGRGLVIGIASSDSEAAIRRTLDHLGLADRVAFVAGYDSGHGRKPGPGMVEGFCRATGLHPQEVAVVGDNLHDMHMGRSAGVGLVVAVGTGTGDRAVLEAEADVWLGSIAELASLLDQTETA